MLVTLRPASVACCPRPRSRRQTRGPSAPCRTRRCRFRPRRPSRTRPSRRVPPPRPARSPPGRDERARVPEDAGLRPVLDDFHAAGFTADLTATDGGVACSTCRSVSPACELLVHRIRRLEGGARARRGSLPELLTRVQAAGSGVANVHAHVAELRRGRRRRHRAGRAVRDGDDRRPRRGHDRVPSTLPPACGTCSPAPGPAATTRSSSTRTSAGPSPTSWPTSTPSAPPSSSATASARATGSPSACATTPSGSWRSPPSPRSAPSPCRSTGGGPRTSSTSRSRTAAPRC